MAFDFNKGISIGTSSSSNGFNFGKGSLQTQSFSLPEQGLAQKIWMGLSQAGQSIGTAYREQITGAVDKFGRSITEGAQRIEKAKTPLQSALARGETGLGTATAAGRALFAPFTAPVAAGIKAITDRISDQTLINIGNLPGIHEIFGTVEAANTWAQQHPREAKAAMDAIELTGYLTGSKGLQTDVGALTKEVFGSLKESAVTKIVTAPIKKVEDVYQNIRGRFGGEGIIEKVQTALSRKNVAETLESSVDRLTKQVPIRSELISDTKIPVKKIEAESSPLKTYDRFYEQELKFKNDAHQDMAIGQVGTRVGNAYEKVIKMRRDAGATMGTEIEKVGKVQTDVSNSFIKFENELMKNGLRYNGETGKVLLSRTAKVTSQDARLISEYIKKVNKLGANPTAAELDAFLSRVPNEIDIFKATNNVTKITNGERIIKGNLKELKSVLTPESNPIFQAYNDARQMYAQLTRFLDEGAGFLGKKTQAGDYAKDASLTKSAVQSILNQGKKDWLLKLEDLTGYPALDESVLALQAMKDAGNFRGSSLLELITDQKSIPTSRRGIAEKVVESGIEFGKKRLLGSPTTQTRRIIQQRILEGKTAIPGQLRENASQVLNENSNIPASMARGGENQSNINQRINPIGENLSQLPKKTRPFGLSLEDVSKIHPEDAKIMERYIDSVRIGKEVPDSLLNDVENLRTHFGIGDISAQRLADKFDDLLSRVRQEKSVVDLRGSNLTAQKAQKYGAEVKGDKIVLYHGTNDPKVKPGELDYGSFLSAVKKGKDITGNSGASEYGKFVHRVELSFSDVRINSTGEFQYIGKSKSLIGQKYTQQIYKEYNDALGSNLTAKEIDKQGDVYNVIQSAVGKSKADKLFKK